MFSLLRISKYSFSHSLFKMSRSLSFLNQVDAQQLDQELMSTPGFSIDQLMELAGLSCACAISKEYDATKYNRVILICGPGNNGGDGLVAARHLKHFGFSPAIHYPKRSMKGDNQRLFSNLVKQDEDLAIPFLDSFPIVEDLSSSYDLVIDAIFGFSFHGSPRAPFDSIITSINQSSLPVVSVDIPSGWDVEKGDINDCSIHSPEMLISLTTPKLCAQSFKGKYHYVGGRFLPPVLAQKFQITLPIYPGCEQCVKVE